MKKITFMLAAILTLSILLGGCGGQTKSLTSDSYGQSAPMASTMPSYDVEWDSEGVSDSVSGKSDSDAIYNSEENKIIRTAELSIQSTDFDGSVKMLNQLTERLGGYYETAEVESGGYYDRRANRSAYYVVRIPKESFEAFRDGTGGIGHVYSIQENAQNVGETYYDTEARLATLTTKRERLLALLEKAEMMEDIITLENALADVQYEIDRHTATLRKYDSLIDYATFRIYLNEVAEIKEEPGEKESFGTKLSANLKKGFEEFGEAMQNVAIWVARNLIGVVIFAAVVVAAIFIARRTVRCRRRREKAEQ